MNHFRLPYPEAMILWNSFGSVISGGVQHLITHAIFMGDREETNPLSPDDFSERGKGCDRSEDAEDPLTLRRALRGPLVRGRGSCGPERSVKCRDWDNRQRKRFEGADNGFGGGLEEGGRG